jgi:RHS repeat-associated protein
VGALNYVYDNGGAGTGNVTSDGAHSYQYDGENRLVKVDSGSTAINTYDAANRRVKKVSSAGTTWYVWEGGAVIAEYGAAPVGASNIRYYHPDRLSTRMITDNNGGVVGAQDHLPFGEDGGVTGENEKHRFTNYERDAESGTDYAVNRQYSTNTGRFLRPDPVQGSITNPQSLNRYSYSNNDPINLSDPLGLTECYRLASDNKTLIPIPCSQVWRKGNDWFVNVTDYNPLVPNWEEWARTLVIDGWGAIGTSPGTDIPTNNDPADDSSSYDLGCLAACLGDVAINFLIGRIPILGWLYEVSGSELHLLQGATGYDNELYSSEWLDYTAGAGQGAGDYSKFEYKNRGGDVRLNRALDITSRTRKTSANLIKKELAVAKTLKAVKKFAKAVPILGTILSIADAASDIYDCFQRCKR